MQIIFNIVTEEVKESPPHLKLQYLARGVNVFFCPKEAAEYHLETDNVNINLIQNINVCIESKAESGQKSLKM